MTSNNALLVLQTFRTEAHPPSHVRAGHRHSGWSVRRRTATADPPTTAVFVLLFRIFSVIQQLATLGDSATKVDNGRIKTKEEEPILGHVGGLYRWRH